MSELRRDIERIDGRPYPAYRDLRDRVYAVGPYRCRFEHVQGDPFAQPSRLGIEVPAHVPGLPDGVRAGAGADARRATADFLHRAVARVLRGARQRTGSGRSGLVEISALGQEVLDRTAIRVGDDGALVVRLAIGLPAAGRRILGREAAELLTERLPHALDEAVARQHIDVPALVRHVKAVEDQVALRAALAERNLVAFLAEGSTLPRLSGADDRPMTGAVPLAAPASLAVELMAPHVGRLRGLGVPRGVTLIVGGGYHGKSTLLDTLARCVYDHIPGDGRERCVSVATAVMVRAEDGRSVRGVDLRPFISNLPLGRATDHFDTDDASGSTSQAAAMVEALEAGADVLLIDEDTAATNFMIRDARMRRLVPAAEEPITPYIDRIQQLSRERGVSSVLVVGGAGDYLDVADTVIQMQSYRPQDVTPQARTVAQAMPLGEAAPRSPGPWPPARPRVPDPRSIDPRRGARAERVRGVRTRAIEFGTEEIDVSPLAQLADDAQCRMIGDVLLECARGLCDGRRSVAHLLDAIDARIATGGLEAVTAPTYGDRAQARRFEIAAALNRLRSLRLL
jgi:predicted ABC-class ATPase